MKGRTRGAMTLTSSHGNAKDPEENGISSASGAASGAATAKKALETAFSAQDAKELLLKLLLQHPELIKELLSISMVL